MKFICQIGQDVKQYYINPKDYAWNEPEERIREAVELAICKIIRDRGIITCYLNEDLTDKQFVITYRMSVFSIE